ncbi:putative inorganic phosphate cotransporter [Pectinophora gossypiella]|uniref:putative inorganic phosphate cotransporter n=1 Tax=Pectinophora gossypiella TaxID=13191 RepID=UPI00214EF1B1|nr:putative inorganic phosphate cotransporter [Pectinophora gossypiella]
MNKNAKDNRKDSGRNSLTIVDGEFKVSGFGCRHQQCFVLFICLATAYSMRACIGVALVGMMEDDPYEETHHNLTHINNTVHDLDETGVFVNASQYIVNVISDNETVSNATMIQYQGDILHGMLLKPPYPKFRWSKKIQDVVISSFFWGYMLLQIPAGQLVHKFGPHRLLVGALTINALVSFCFPWASYYGGFIFASICRFVQGLSQACIIPGMYGFFGQWTPLEERSRLVGFAMGGQAIGTVLGLPLTGFIAASPLGWPGIFRFFGVLSGLVALLVYFLITDTPAQHPRISTAERRYIEEGLGLKYGEKQKKLRVPWVKILKTKALYAIMVAHISNTWGQVTLFTEIPSYMDKVMGVNIKANGMLTALPFFVMWFTNFFFSWLTDMIIVKKWLSLTNARKLANTIGGVPPAIGLVVLAYAPKDVYVIESILVFICAFKIAAHVGSMVTHIDITPNFAGTTMSLSNFVSNLVGSQAPLAAGFLLTDVTSEYQWRKVFFVSAGLYFFTNLVYVIFGTAERAPWNDPEEDRDDQDPEAKPMVDKKNNGVNNETVRKDS